MAFDWKSLLPILEDILGMLKGTGQLSTTGNQTVDQHLATLAAAKGAPPTSAAAPAAPAAPVAPVSTSTVPPKV